MKSKCLQGIALYKTKQWTLCIDKLQEAITLKQTDDFFVCLPFYTNLLLSLHK